MTEVSPKGSLTQRMELNVYQSVKFLRSTHEFFQSSDALTSTILFRFFEREIYSILLLSRKFREAQLRLCVRKLVRFNNLSLLL